MAAFIMLLILYHKQIEFVDNLRSSNPILIKSSDENTSFAFVATAEGLR